MRPISRSTMSDVYLWETYDKLGREALDSGDLEQANEAFRSAIATAEEIQAHDRLVLSLRNLAATMQDMNQMADAHELLVRTLDVAQQQLGNDHSQTVETLRDLSQLSQQLGYLDKADGLLKQVLEQDIKSQSADRIGSTLLSLARLAQARNEPAVAAAYLQRVVKLNRQKHGDNHPEVAQSLLWLATALYQCGKKDEAQSFMRTAFGLMERHFGNEPMHLAQSLLAGAKLMVDAGQLEPALVHQKRALDLLSEELEPENERLWETREYIATTLAAMGKLEEAIEILEYCFRHGNPQGARAGATYKNLAGLYLALNKKEKAEGLYLKASEVLESTLGIEHPAYLATQEERIQLYHFSGRSKEALEVALKTIRATEKRFGTGHPNTAQAYASTALLAHSSEQWETALELMKAAEKIWSSLDPRPEEVLANCHANIATCLIRMNRHAEAEPSLVIAESWGNAALKPVLAELRAEMAGGKETAEEPTPEPDLMEVDSAEDLFGGPDQDEEGEELFTQGQLDEEEESAQAEPPRELDDHEAIELFADESRAVMAGAEETPTEEPEESNPEAEQQADYLFEDVFGDETEPEEADHEEPENPFSEEPDDVIFAEDSPEVDVESEAVPDLPDEEGAESESETDVLADERLDEIPVEPDAEPETADEHAELENEPEAIPEDQADDTPAEVSEEREADADDLFSDAEDDDEFNLEASKRESEQAAEQEDESAASEDVSDDSPVEDEEEPVTDADDLFSDAEEQDEVGPETAEESELEPDADDLFSDHQDEDEAGLEAAEAPEPSIEKTPAVVALDEDEESNATELFADAEGDVKSVASDKEPSEEDEPDPDAFELFSSDSEADRDESDSDELFAADTEAPEEDSSEDEEPVLSSVPETNHPDSPNFVERRAAPRRPLSFNQFFQVLVASETGSEDNLKSFLVDLGEGGIRINSESPFPTEYDLTITLPEDVLGETATLECQVVWQKALYGASFIQGLAFQNLTESHKKLIEAKLNPENGLPRSASRQHFRLYRPFPIKLQADGPDEWVTSYATDLSVNGIGTRLKAPLEQGDPIRLRLELEFELPTVEVEARVAWSKSGENGVSHGLQFAEVGPVEARTIKRYIDRCLEFLPD